MLHLVRASLGASWLESGSSVTNKGNLPYGMCVTDKVGSVSVFLGFSRIQLIQDSTIVQVIQEESRIRAMLT